MKSRNLSCSLLALLVFLLASAQAGMAAPPPTNPGQDRVSQMLADGWKPVANGVLKRQAGQVVETFALGEAGFAFVYQELRSQLGFLIGEYRRHPSPKLAQAIDSVRAEMVRTQSDIETLQSLTSTPTAVGCDFSYGAHAHAYGTSPAQGVQADSSAYFNNNCDYIGETYAYAYARATAGTVTTTKTQTDPRSGANIASAASAAANGSIDCYSYGYARASSVDLGISYSTAQDNYLCPPSPPTVTVSGLANVYISGFTCKTVTWTSTVTGGSTPYASYAWQRNGYQVGSGTSYSEVFCGDNYTWIETANVSLTVTDNFGQQGTGSYTTYIHYSGTAGGGGCLLSSDTLLQQPSCLY